jgi:DNA-directed RNA polymerase subunit RPC12/RpoP
VIEILDNNGKVRDWGPAVSKGSVSSHRFKRIQQSAIAKEITHEEIGLIKRKEKRDKMNQLRNESPYTCDQCPRKILKSVAERQIEFGAPVRCSRCIDKENGGNGGRLEKVGSLSRGRKKLNQDRHPKNYHIWEEVLQKGAAKYYKCSLCGSIVSDLKEQHANQVVYNHKVLEKTGDFEMFDHCVEFQL